jgi:hypothetical protein
MPYFYQFYLDFTENEERLTIEKSVRKMTIPHFIIHGDNDPAVSIKEGKNCILGILKVFSKSLKTPIMFSMFHTLGQQKK